MLHLQEVLQDHDNSPLLDNPLTASLKLEGRSEPAPAAYGSFIDTLLPVLLAVGGFLIVFLIVIKCLQKKVCTGATGSLRAWLM